ncbi:MAG: hypothetical protein IPL26_26285 [Leptospiraceae bacterium]|nr:hypothetical protein [Leptospiraceae bacterium]
MQKKSHKAILIYSVVVCLIFFVNILLFIKLDKLFFELKLLEISTVLFNFITVIFFSYYIIKEFKNEDFQKSIIVKILEKLIESLTTVHENSVIIYLASKQTEKEVTIKKEFQRISVLISAIAKNYEGYVNDTSKLEGVKDEFLHYKSLITDAAFGSKKISEDERSKIVDAYSDIINTIYKLILSLR